MINMYKIPKKSTATHENDVDDDDADGPDDDADNGAYYSKPQYSYLHKSTYRNSHRNWMTHKQKSQHFLL